jgi:hypothetical protein
MLSTIYETAFDYVHEYQDMENEGKKRCFVINSSFQAVFVQSLLDLFVNPDLPLDSFVNFLIFIVRYRRRKNVITHVLPVVIVTCVQIDAQFSGVSDKLGKHELELEGLQAVAPCSIQLQSVLISLPD